MMKSRKVALWSIAIVTVVVALATFAFYSITDNAKLQKMARDHVRKTWSRELTTGDLSLTFTPMPEIHVTQLAVSNPTWAREKNFLEAKTLNARLELLPFLTGRFVIDSLSVDDFRINLQRISDGRVNWQASGSQPTTAANPSRPALAGMSLGALTLSKGTITFRDSADETPAWQIENAQLESNPGWRDVKLDFRLSRHGQAVQVHSKLDDVSQLGAKNAVSNGNLRVQAGQASLVVAGQLPIDAALQSYKVNAVLDAPSLNDVFAFAGMPNRSPAAWKGKVNLQAENGVIDASDMKLQIGKLDLTGSVKYTRHATTPHFDAKLNTGPINWAQTRLDLGLPPLPPKPAGELFYDNPLPWPLIAATAGKEGTLHAAIQSLKLRSGIEVSNLVADMTFADGRVNIRSFNSKVLGGTATGSAVLNGAPQSAQVDLRIKDALLGTWVAQTHKKVGIVGGRMQITAAFTAHGKSMKELAASITGPVTFNVGPATVKSKNLSEAEALFSGLTPFLTAKGADQVDLACIAARLPFERGVARGNNLIGVRSDASQLLTNGSVDLRQQTLSLTGPLRARAGISIGISTFASDIKIDGKIAAPSFGLDKAAAPGVIARIAAAVLTGGASIIGTTIWDGAQAAPNPCQVVLASIPAAQPRQNGQASRQKLAKP